RHSLRDPTAMTTANMMVWRERLIEVSGFDREFTRYGFEDRDLLLRLARSGAKLRVNPPAAVWHSDAVSFPLVFKKLQECGAHSGPLFRTKHPAEYRTMAYARFDASLHPLLARILVPCARLMRSRAADVENFLQLHWVPFVARSALARLGSALAYCL